MGKEIIGDHSLQVKLNLSVSVVSHRVVSLDVLCDGLTARASSVFEDFYSSNDHFTVLGVASRLIGLRSGILWSRHVDSQSMRVVKYKQIMQVSTSGNSMAFSQNITRPVWENTHVISDQVHAAKGMVHGVRVCVHMKVDCSI